MNEFKLTVFRQNRILLVIFMLPVTLLASVFIAAELSHLEPLNFLISGAILVLTGFCLLHISIGRLTVKIDDQILKFSWSRKTLFNYKPIEPVKLMDIRTLVIDDQILLRKLQTDERQIQIGTAKIMKKDATEFITFLKTHTTAEQIDSWDVWKRRGWLAIAYRINTFILLFSGIGLIAFIFIKGFNSALLLYFPLAFFQLIGYHYQMRNKM